MSSGPHSGPTVVLGSSPQETLARLAEEAAEMSAQLRELAERASVAEKQEAQSTRSTPSTQKGETAAARILVADDETVIRVMLARYLRKQGYEVTEAIDGTAALEAAQKEAFDLVLTDMQMPGLNGLGLLKALKANEATRDVPLIVLSGQGDSGAVVECLKNGADDYVPKPYEFAVLDARVGTALDRKRMHDLERGYRARVAVLTTAAEAVERETYASEQLAAVMDDGDEIGRLARVFDRMVTSLRSREERLERRVSELRREMNAASGARRAAVAEEDGSLFRTGETLARRYEILGILGTGGMGTVYRARDTELGEQVAIKVVRPDIIKQDRSIVERLKSEIRLARKLSHPNVVRAHDLGEWSGTYFISMEYVQGLTVSDLLDRRGRLGVGSVLAIGTQMAQALAVAHDARIIHRDIKPANLLIDESGVLKVMDFGIAVHTERTDKLTMGGFIVGTPQYMAPEQLRGGEVDGRADLFALGVVLYECLAGKPPFDAESPTELMQQMTSRAYERIDARVVAVPAPLATLIHQLLEFQPSRRPASARVVAERLAEIEPPKESETMVELELLPLAGAP